MKRSSGRTVEDIAGQRSADPLETYLDLIVEDDDRIVAIFDYIDGEDVAEVLSHPLTMISSDGFASSLPGQMPPRSPTGPAVSGSTPACSSTTSRSEASFVLKKPCAR